MHLHAAPSRHTGSFALSMPSVGRWTCFPSFSKAGFLVEVKVLNLIVDPNYSRRPAGRPYDGVFSSLFSYSPTTKKSKEWTLFRATIDFRPAVRPVRSLLSPHALCPVRHMQPQIESHTVPPTLLFSPKKISFLLPSSMAPPVLGPPRPRCLPMPLAAHL